MTDIKGPAGAEMLNSWTEDAVAFIQINRSQKANSYNQQLLMELDNLLNGFEYQSTIKVIIICGAGEKNFCSGADLDEMDGLTFRDALDLKSAKLFSKIATFPKITIAAINGAAVAGGLELALACDLRIASENAKFFFPETNIGLIPAAGGTQRLPRIVGPARAKELILGGKIWNAEKALRYGLANEVVKLKELLATARRWAKRISQRDCLALTLAKKAIDNNCDGFGLQYELLAEALLYQLRKKK